MISIEQSNGWLDCNPFSSYHIPVQRKDREYLVMSEVEAIINVVFTRRKRLYELIRDLFIFVASQEYHMLTWRTLQKRT